MRRFFSKVGIITLSILIMLSNLSLNVMAEANTNEFLFESGWMETVRSFIHERLDSGRKGINAQIDADNDADDTISIIASGTCGENVEWTLDNKGLLRVFGEGEMTTAPWEPGTYGYRNDVKEVIVEDGVTSICADAFFYCINMEKITVGNDVEIIKHHACYGCARINRVILGASVKVLEGSAFQFGAEFETEEELEEYTQNRKPVQIDVYSSIEHMDNWAISEMQPGSEIYFHADISVFSNTSEYELGLASETFTAYYPEGSTYVPDEKWADANKITWVPYSSTNDGETILDEEPDSGSASPGIVDSDFTIDSNGVLQAYYGSESLVEVPVGVTEIGDHAFSGQNIEKVILPEGVVRIGKNAFKDCASLQEINMPDSIEEIDDHAFDQCVSLNRDSRLPSSLTTIGDSAFKNCNSLTGELVIPDSVASIGSCAFMGCSGLASLKIGNSINEIYDSTFEGCSSLSGKLTIPDSVRQIDNAAFTGCTGIESVVFGKGLQRLDAESYNGSSFYGCDGIKEIEFLSETPPYIGYNNRTYSYHFVDHLKNLEIIWVPTTAYQLYFDIFAGALKEAQKFKARTNDDFVIVNGVLQSYEGHDSIVEIPENAIEIGNGAFYNNTTVERVVLHNGLVRIGKHAFENCSSLQAVNFPEGIEEICDYAFSECKELEGNLNLPQSLKTIGEAAFADCVNLEGNLIIPDSVEYIGTYAFVSCTGFTGDLVIGNGVVEIGSTVFAGCSGFRGELTLGSSLVKIGSHAFANMSNLSGSLFIPDSVTDIGDGAFYDDKSLSGTLKIGKNVQKISASAFQDCKGFTGVLYLPDGVKISASAFGYCTGLTGVVFGNVEGYLCSVHYGSYDPFIGCTEIISLTFTSGDPPVLNDDSSVQQEFIEQFFSTHHFKNLETIYVPAGRLEAYEAAWGSKIPETVSFSNDIKQSAVTCLIAEKVRSHSVSLSWRALEYNGIYGYRVYRDNVLVHETQYTSFEDSGLSLDGQYIYNVVGYTLDGEQTSDSTLTIQTIAPSVLNVYSEIPENKIVESKNLVSALVEDKGNLDGATGKFFYTDLTGLDHQIGQTLSLASNHNANGAIYQTQWDLRGLEAGEYNVKFILTDKDNETASKMVEFTYDNSRPDPITNFLAIGNTNEVLLSWNISHQLDTNKYNIYRMSENEDDYSLLTMITKRNTLSYTDKAVDNELKYHYYITCVNDLGTESLPSDVTVAIPQNDTEKPQVVQMTPVNNSVFGKMATIYAQAKDNIAVKKTELYLSTDGGEAWELMKSMDSNYCSYNFDSTGYGDSIIQFKAIAYDTSDNESTPLIYTYKTDNTGPEKVTGLDYESTATTVTLKWDDVADKDFYRFNVEKKNDGGSFVSITNVYSTLGVNLTALVPDTEYTYRVIAYDRYGNRGVESDELTVRTLADTMAPVITGISPSPGYYSSQIPVTVTAYDDSDISSITFQTSYDAMEWTDVYTTSYSGRSQSKSQTYRIDLTSYDEGLVYVRGIASDMAGNVSNTSVSAPYVQHVVDRTAPESPVNVKAQSTLGAIEVSWDMGSEDDLNNYKLYRSKDNEIFNVIASSLRTLNYWDRSVEKGVTYYYALAVNDYAGNESLMSDSVSAMLPEDVEPPVINSYSPASGQVIGAGNNSFSLLASDNWKLSEVKVTYTVNNSETVKTLISKTGINDYYTNLSAGIPVSSLNDGDQVHLKIEVTDYQGLSAVQEGILYTIDKTNPRVGNVNVEGDTEKIRISWTGYAENDLAGYRIYRKKVGGSYSMIGQRNATADLVYDDYNAAAKETYYYKVVAVDRYGNSSGKESEAAWLVVVPTIKAYLSVEQTQETLVEYYFDASSSSADLGIEKYSFDFGDGTIVDGNKAKVIHRYLEEGDYYATVTVTDTEGRTTHYSRNISVRNPKTLGNLTIRITDNNGGIASNMPVYFDMDGDQHIKATNASGYVTFTAEPGQYVLGVYNDGYLPVRKSVIVRSGQSTTMDITVIKEPIVTGEFEVNRMTLDEIRAAGIDVANPANQQVVRFTIHLTYGTTPVSMNVVTNGKTVYSGETVIVNTSEGKRKLTANVIDLGETKRASGSGSGSGSTGSGGGGSYTGSGQLGEDSIVAILDIPVEGSYLKEFFDVKLHIINHADEEYELTENVVTLRVPEGMSLVETIENNASAIRTFSSLRGQQKKTIGWTLRGDEAGLYDLEADYTGILSKFDAVVNAKFVTEEPIEVFGKNAVKYVADINTNIIHGGMYFNLSMVNIGGADIYLPSIEMFNKMIFEYEQRKEEKETSDDDTSVNDFVPMVKEVKLIGRTISNSSGYYQNLPGDYTVDVLSPGEQLTMKYVSYNSVTTDDILYLQEALNYMAESESIEVEINTYAFDLYSIENAKEKQDSINTSLTNRTNLLYFIDPNNEHFYYYQNGIETDEDWFAKLGVAFKKSTECVLDFNLNLFTNESLKDTTRKVIVELMEDEAFQERVEAKINDTYFRASAEVLSDISDLLPKDKAEIVAGIKVGPWVTEVLGQAAKSENTARLAEGFMRGGEEGFLNVLKTIAKEYEDEETGGALYRYFNEQLESCQYTGVFADSLKEQLGEIAGIIEPISKVLEAWNESIELTNDLVVINAARYEAGKLLDILLKYDYVNGTIYGEIQNLKNTLDDGKISQDRNFATEVAKIGTEYGLKQVVDLALNALSKTKIFDGVGYSIKGVQTAMKLGYKVLDSMFKWDSQVEMIEAMRVYCVFTLALRREVLDNQFSDDSEEFLRALKYLIKVRILGEKTYLDLASELDGDTALRTINLSLNSNYQSLDEYYQTYRSLMLSYRDELFGEVVTNIAMPEAPKVTINHVNEVTWESFSNEYEYSFDGINWTSCDGGTIALNPNSRGKHLWVRVKESDSNRSGNITKVYIEARQLPLGDVKATRKNGVYRVSGITGSVKYALAEDRLETLDETEMIDAQGMIEIASDRDASYFAYQIPATSSSFESQVRNVFIEHAKKLGIVNNDECGAVYGAGEYLLGEVATLRVEENFGYAFLGWYEGERLLSGEKECTFDVYSDMAVEARYRETNEVCVVFKGWNERFLSSESYTVGQTLESDIAVPMAGVPDGYVFKEWRLNGAGYTDNALLRTALANAFASGETLTVQAWYEAVAKEFSVSVSGGRLADGSASGTYRVSDAVSLSADVAPAGMKFAYWTINGVIAGYERKYRFKMPSKDIQATAVFSSEAASVEAKGVTRIESMGAEIENRKLVFVSVSTVPEGCAILKAGIVATSDPAKAVSLTSANADFVRGDATTAKTYKYTWRKTKVTEEQTWYARAYLSYRDSDGDAHEVYGDLCVASFRARVQFNGLRGVLLSSKEYGQSVSADDIEVPNAGYMDGYRFAGWKAGGQLFDADSVKAYIAGEVAQLRDTVVEADYEQVEKEYGVAVTGGLLENGGAEGRFRPSMIVFAKAEVPEGMKLRHWLKNGQVAGLEETLGFRMPEMDVSLEAVFESDGDQAAPTGIAYIESVTPHPDTSKLSFVSIVSVPDGWKIIKAGIVATQDAEAAKDLTAENAQYVRGDATTARNYKYTWTKTKVAADQTWYVRAYLECMDNDGTAHEIYGGLTEGKMEGE